MYYFKAIHLILTNGHLITDMVSRELKEFGISEQQYNVLQTLKAANGKPLTVREILNKMIQQGSNITRIVDKLQSKGLVDRKENKTNRRKMDITITQKGLELLKPMDKKVKAMHKPLMKNLNDRELETLYHLLHKLTIQEN